jgi:hypothetical protein
MGPLLLFLSAVGWVAAQQSAYWDVSFSGQVVNDGLAGFQAGWGSAPAPNSTSSSTLAQIFNLQWQYFYTHSATHSAAPSSEPSAAATASALQSPPAGLTPTAAQSPTEGTATLSPSATLTTTSSALFPLPSVITTLSNINNIVVLLGLSNALDARGLNLIAVLLDILALLAASPVRRLETFSEVSTDALAALGDLVDLSTCTLPECLQQLQSALARTICANNLVIDLLQKQCGLEPLFKARRLPAAGGTGELTVSEGQGGAMLLTSTLADTGSWYDVSAPPGEDLGLSGIGLAWSTTRLLKVQLVLREMSAITIDALSASIAVLTLLAEIEPLLPASVLAGALGGSRRVEEVAVGAQGPRQLPPCDLPCLVSQLIEKTRLLQSKVVNLATANSE